jgi:hypothetical protein
MSRMKELWLNNLEKEEVEEQEGVSTEFVDDYLIKHRPKDPHYFKSKNKQNSILTQKHSTL